MSVAELSQPHSDPITPKGPAQSDHEDGPALERIARSLKSIEDVVTGAALANPLILPGALVTAGALAIFNPFTARKIAGAQSDMAFKNIEKEVRFVVFDQSILGSTPVSGASVTFVLGLTQGAGLSATMGGKATSSSVTVKTGNDGQAVAYLVGGATETVILTGQTANSITTIEAKTTINIQ